MRNLRRMILSVAGFLFLGATSWGLEPFDNWANPPGHYAVVYPAVYSADELLDKDGNILASDLNFSQTGVVLRGVTYNTSPFSYLLSLYAPIYQVKSNNPFTGREEKVSGLGDITLVGGWFFIDDKQKNLYVGVGLKLDLPTGAYDANRLFANLGEDVWRVRPLLSFAKLTGPVDVEASLTYRHETENSDTKARDGDELALETFVGMFLNQQWMVGAHLNTTAGQDDEVSGVEIPDSSDRFSQLGASVQYLLNPKANVLIEYLQDFGVENTLKGRLILIRGAYKF